MEDQICSQLSQLEKQLEEMREFKAGWNKYREEMRQFREYTKSQFHEVSSQLDEMSSKLDTIIELLPNWMRRQEIEPLDLVGAPLDHLNADPEASTLVSMAGNSKPMVMQNLIGHSNREPVDDRILVVNEMPDSKWIISCESTIEHSIDEENEQDEENDDNGCGMLSFVYVQSILSSVCESSKKVSTNGSPKSWVRGVISRMDVVLGQNAMKEDAHLMFDKMTKAIPINVFEDDKGMKSFQNNYSSIQLQAEPCSICLQFCRDNNLIYAAFVDIQNAILITDIEVLFYFDPGGCSLPQMVCCDPFEFNGEQTYLSLNTNIPDISVKAIIRKLRTRIASVCGVNVFIDRAVSANGLYMFVQIGMGQKGHCIRGVNRSSCVELIVALCGYILQNGGSEDSSSGKVDETLEGFQFITKMEGMVTLFLQECYGDSSPLVYCSMNGFMNFLHTLDLPVGSLSKGQLKELMLAVICPFLDGLVDKIRFSTVSTTQEDNFTKNFATINLMFLKLLTGFNKWVHCLKLCSKMCPCVASYTLNREVQNWVFIGDKVIFLVQFTCCWILSLDGLTNELDFVSSFGTWLCLLFPWGGNFAWDPGICAIFVDILGDKDVFERVGKWIIPRDITWVKMEVIKDVQNNCIIMDWCQIARYLRLSCDNSKDGYMLQTEQYGEGLAEVALDSLEVPVCCVIVEDGKVIALGRNRTTETRKATKHTGVEAIDVLLDQWQIDGLLSGEAACMFSNCTLYVTCEPCIMCTTSLSIIGVNEVYYECSNDKFRGCGSILSLHTDKRVDPSLTGEQSQMGFKCKVNLNEMGHIIGRGFVHLVCFGKKQSIHWHMLLHTLVSRYGIPPSFQLTKCGLPPHDNIVQLKEVGWRLALTLVKEFMFSGFVVVFPADIVSMLDIPKSKTFRHIVKNLKFQNRAYEVADKLKTSLINGLSTYVEMMDQGQHMYGVNKFIECLPMGYWLYVCDVFLDTISMILVYALVPFVYGLVVEGFPTSAATSKIFVWDPGVCHFTTLRTRRLLRGRICHVPRLKLERRLKNALVPVKYELLAVSDVICDVITLCLFSIIRVCCLIAQVVKGYIIERCKHEYHYDDD